MKTIRIRFLILLLMSLFGNYTQAQDDSLPQAANSEKLKLTGEWLTDERIIAEHPNDWIWNENRLDLKFSKKSGSSKFNSEIWVRHFGFATTTSMQDLYNKAAIEPVEVEIREANLYLPDFIIKNLDAKIGRQRIAWGKADKLNPTDNLNPYDMEDIIDFGRHRSSDAISLEYFFNTDFSLQGVYVPFHSPANLPTGVFSNALMPELYIAAPLPINPIINISSTANNLQEASSGGFRFKGIQYGIDFSLSYAWTRATVPMLQSMSFYPDSSFTALNLYTNLNYPRMHVIGADMAANVAGIGVWAEGAAFIPEQDVISTIDMTMLINPYSPVKITKDSLLLDKKEPTYKFIAGADYHFTSKTYLNIQYLHGFMHEFGKDNLNDYFFLKLEQQLLNDKLKVSPLMGAFIVNDWSDLKNNYAMVYMPEIAYKATDDAEIILSSAIFEGKGEGMFSTFKDLDMLIFKLKYNF